MLSALADLRSVTVCDLPCSVVCVTLLQPMMQHLRKLQFIDFDFVSSEWHPESAPHREVQAWLQRELPWAEVHISDDVAEWKHVRYLQHQLV